jgi:Tfp pilus assembly PilM family ATPase
MGKGSMLFSRPLVGCADSNFVDQLQRDLGVGREKADEIKRMYRSGGDLGLAEEAMKVFMNTEARFTSRVALEVQRSIDGFMIVFDRKAVTKINICGGGADWPGRIDHLKNTLGIECQLFDPFAKIDTSMFAVEALKKNKMMYAVAAGLAVD